MEQSRTGPMAGRTVLVTGAAEASAGRPPWAWPRWAHTWRSPAGTAGALRTRPATTVGRL